ncbi:MULTISPECIES: hypothetical protein [Roseovarius]|jgi:hypothetical protein|uniref:hypothetical protein n=1 Tax=Roseovarius TaxID=74030 RepID=UPI00273FC626|nr:MULTISPECIES: hypothetical protein [unclassified Roseovarius]
MFRHITGLALIALGATPAAATSPIADILCEPSHTLTQKLSRQFGVTRFARGTQGPDQLMEVWTDESGGWTLVVAYATGTSCIVAMGENWDKVQAENPA